VPLFYHDGTERPVQRPVDTDEQADYDSGKKRCHTVKNILLINERCTIQFMSPTHAGKWHEKSIVDDEHYGLSAGSILYQDMGFQGFAVASVTIKQPKKKPRGGELTPEQKEDNRRIASEKLRIEHTICSVKRCRIVKDKIRYWQDCIREMVMEIACGLDLITV
jgi:DDE superfamily endonuclease